MNLLDAIPSLPRIPGLPATPVVQITFTPALPPQVRAQIANQSAEAPFTLTVSRGNGSQLTFTSPTGATFTATVNPPLPVGTQLQLSVANLLPNAPAAVASTFPIQARILPPDVPANAALPNTSPIPLPTAQTPVQILAPTATLTLQLPTNTTATTALQNLVTTTILQTIAPPATSTALPVPAGPVAASFPSTITPSLISTPLTLTPTAPMKPDGTQTATLTTPQTPPLPIVLNLGVPLPLKSSLAAILLPATTPGATQPVLVLTTSGNSVLAAPAPALQIQTSQPQTPAANQTPQFITESRTPISARILPPLPNQTPSTQTALLANGATITLKSPQPLPTGSIIVADLPITASTGIQRVLTPDAQSQPQPNTTSQSQAAPPVAPQTQQAVLAPGMLIQGTITGQNEQGQPLLTITQPPAMAGQQAALNLTENTTLLPVGAQLSIRVENSLTATILGLTLPPQTQAAYTVGTIGARWEGLQQALSTLQQQAPAQAANMRAALPQLANLLPGLLAFTNGLRTNDPDDIFDAQTTRLLKSLGIDLSSDISQLSQLQQRPASHADTQWRGTLFPYVEAPGEDPRQGGFFWRREKSDNPRASTSTRFVVEVEMTQLGAMQLDGLITYPEVWLKLRRTSAPETDFTEGLQTLVNSLLESYGLSGGISVETTATFPVNPRTELLAQTDNPLPTSA